MSVESLLYYMSLSLVGLTILTTIEIVNSGGNGFISAGIGIAVICALWTWHGIALHLERKEYKKEQLSEPR